MENTQQREGHALLLREEALAADNEFINVLKNTLSDSVQVEDSERDIVKPPATQAPELISVSISWIGIIFAFASTTIATATLTKLSEDLYQMAKERIIKKLDEKREQRRQKESEQAQKHLEQQPIPLSDTRVVQGKYQVGLKIEIHLEENLLIYAQVSDESSESYEALVEAMRELPQVLIRVREDQRKRIEVQEKYKEYGLISRSNNIFNYKYDPSRKAWIYVI